MLALYLASLAFGGVLLGVSMLLGGGADSDSDVDVDHDMHLDVDHGLDLDVDHDLDLDVDHDLGLDVDHDVDLDVDHDADHHAPLDAASENVGGDFWKSFLSMRFFTFGSFAFGLAGTLLTIVGAPWLLVFGLSVALGGGLGLVAARLFRHLTRDTVTADVGLRQFVGQEARVLLPVRPDGIGKIVIDTMAGQLELPARTGDKVAIPRGSRVLIADIDDGTADVTSIPTLPHAEPISERDADPVRQRRRTTE